MRSDFQEVQVECYAGYKGEETPRALVLDGKRLEVAGVLSRKRALDPADGKVREIWLCRLEDGRAVVVERVDDVNWRAYAAI